MPTPLSSKALRVLGPFLLFFAAMAGWAQFPQGFSTPPGERVDADKALDRALKNSSLTWAGEPFHAVLEIGSKEDGYSGRVEVWWVNPTTYRLEVHSPKFSQVKIVNGEHVSEKDTGDYYPRWLENFVLAILDPVPMAKNFRGRGEVMLRPNGNACLSRNDRPGGITDQMTWGNICFKGDEPLLSSELVFNVGMEYSDWQKFGKKKIARTYKTDVLSYEPVTGNLIRLEKLEHPGEALFTVDADTPPGQRISTELVSTLTEEGMVENAPKIVWPSVREGKTDGYMIVYARTDTTGQVRKRRSITPISRDWKSLGWNRR